MMKIDYWIKMNYSNKLYHLKGSILYNSNLKAIDLLNTRSFWYQIFKKTLDKHRII